MIVKSDICARKNLREDVLLSEQQDMITVIIISSDSLIICVPLGPDNVGHNIVNRVLITNY